MKLKSHYLIFALTFVFIGLGVYSNIRQDNAKDRSKLPAKVEESRQFQRWITNLRNKDLVIEADGFNLDEEVEIYNTKWMKVYSAEDEDRKKELADSIEANKTTEKIVFSPSEREYLDFRNIERDGYLPNEVRFYGQKEDKIIDARILDCSTRNNCYFDRAYFLSNDLFVITEISRNVDKRDLTVPVCAPTEMCTYTFKLHLIDLINNSRLVYESQPFDTVLLDLIPQL
jgi:hypothetical protein